MGYDYEYYLKRNRLSQRALRILQRNHSEEYKEIFEKLKLEEKNKPIS